MKSKFIIVLIVLVLAGIGGGGMYLYQKSKIEKIEVEKDCNLYRSKEYTFEFCLPEETILSEADMKIHSRPGLYFYGPIFINKGEGPKSFVIYSQSPDYREFEFDPFGFSLGLSAEQTAEKKKLVREYEGKIVYLSDGSKAYLVELQEVDTYAFAVYIDVPLYLGSPYKIYIIKASCLDQLCRNSEEKTKIISFLELIASTFKFIK